MALNLVLTGVMFEAHSHTALFGPSAESMAAIVLAIGVNMGCLVYGLLHLLPSELRTLATSSGRKRYVVALAVAVAPMGPAFVMKAQMAWTARQIGFLSVAAKAYRQHHGYCPSSVHDLVPDYIERVPQGAMGPYFRSELQYSSHWWPDEASIGSCDRFVVWKWNDTMCVWNTDHWTCTYEG